MKKKSNSLAQIETDERHSRARRRLLQSIAAGGTAISVKNLPEQWAKPMLDVTILPAHAKASVAATLACELSDVDANPTANSPLRGIPSTPPENPFDPSLTGGQLGTLFGWGSELNVGNGTVTFDVDVYATIDPITAGPVTLMVGGGLPGTLDIDGGGNQVVAPNPSGEVSFGGVTLQVTNPTSDTGTFSETVEFNFSAAGEECIINLEFREGLPG